MSPKLILGLAVVTILTAAAAVVAVSERPNIAPVAIGQEPAFPELRAASDSVARVVIQTAADGEVVLAREGERWVAPQRQGYPVATGPVRDLLVGLAEMRLIEAKTEVAERYPRLEVEDLDAEGANSRLLRVESADGEVLAEALIGKPRYRLTGTEPGGTYIRRPDEARSWLASGGLALETRVAGWLEAPIINLAPDRIARIEINPAEAEGYAIVRGGEEDNLTLEGLTEQESLAEDANLTQVSGTFRGLELEDVRPADDVDWPAQVDQVELATLDGLRLALRLARIEDDVWLEVVSAEAVELAAEPAEKEPEVEPEALAAEIQARTEGWSYRVATSVHDLLSAPRESWLADDDGTS